MSTLIFNGARCAYALPDNADVSHWPIYSVDGREMLDASGFEPIIITGQTVTVPEQYITQSNGAVTQDTAQYAADQAEIAAREKVAHNAPIITQLNALDIKRIRPTAEGDTAYLATLNAQAVALRAQLK